MIMNLFYHQSMDQEVVMSQIYKKIITTDGHVKLQAHYTAMKIQELKKKFGLVKKLNDYGCKEFERYTKPLYTWTPSIAASQGIQYQSDYFEIFKNNIILDH